MLSRPETRFGLEAVGRLPWRSRRSCCARGVYGHQGFPGVAEAVAELGARGEERASLYLWRPDGP